MEHFKFYDSPMIRHKSVVPACPSVCCCCCCFSCFLAVVFDE